MEAGKQPLDFISFDCENHPPGSHLKKNKIDYKIILNNIPIPISLWESENNDFRLVYLNHSAKTRLQQELRPGMLLSESLPDEYRKVLSYNPHIFSSVPGSSFTTPCIKLINQDQLLIYHQSCNDLFGADDAKRNNDDFGDEALKKIIEQTPVSMIITDIEGKIKYVNPKFVEVTGYSAEEVIGKNPRLLKSGKKTSEEYKILWDTIRSGNVWRGEFINKRKNGELYYELAVIWPLKDENGSITHFYAAKEDITKLKEAESELNKAEKFAVLGKMAAYVAHEIKTPLTSIKLNIDLLQQDGSIHDECRKSLSIIQKEVNRFDKLLKNILQFSHNPNLYFSNVDLSKKIENIHEFIKPLLAAHNITLQNHTSGAYIYGDPQQLRSLFIHLLENSIESINNSGEIEIYSEMTDNECHIYIKDSGCGINDNKDIFEPFYTTKSGGTGLGLSIAKNIVDRHNGILKLISSKPGETIFEIILPNRGEIGKTTYH